MTVLKPTCKHYVILCESPLPPISLEQATKTVTIVCRTYSFKGRPGEVCHIQATRNVNPDAFRGLGANALG
jgi:hypothetical protein